jgi:hypothetical protein
MLGAGGEGGTLGTGGEGGTSMVPLCTKPGAVASEACSTCMSNLGSGDACLARFSMTCAASPGCVAFEACLTTCLNNGMGGAGGGGSDCVAMEGCGGAAVTSNKCETCCQTVDAAGASTYARDLIDACVCTPGAPCASACAM